ncbi:MAG: glycoside hydrolase family 13 protein [Ignavibacteria bacterium]|nr:MAG: glycoside hydrolase family 13 protein [Ignavibacteria bacterium]
MKKLILLFVAVCLFSCAESGMKSKVPGWAKKAVWYQIFPERFNNGDKNNDPTTEDIKGVWPYEIPEGWQVHPWTSDWYKLQPWEENGHGFYWNAGVRRYGGDLQGVIDKLDYLDNLGINAIYLNPIFESNSLHKYDATMYRHVDNNFGPNPELDKKIWNAENPLDETTWKWTTADSLFLKLLDEAHKRNIKVIIDGVFNHVGTLFWAFQDVVKNQEKSKFKDWFTITQFDDPSTEKNEFDYEGWIGIKSLPEFREDENGLVKGPREHIHKIVKRWMDPNGDGDPSDGIDGWRLDVAEIVNHNFWKDFRKWVKGINPDAYITGEVWWEDWKVNKMFNAAPWLQGDQFDAVMNYRFTRALKRFVSDNKIGIGPDGFIDSLFNQYRDYDRDNVLVMMNLLGSHDTERLSSMIVNPDIWYDHGAIPTEDNNWDVRKPNEIERAKQRLMVGIQMTLPGAPHIYYGEEAGMWGGDDPDDRKPMVWPEFKYEVETHHPFGKERPADKVEFDNNLFGWYKKMIHIRRMNEELSLGEIEFKVVSEEKKVLSYKRLYLGSECLIVVNNNKNKFIIPHLAFFELGGKVKDLVANKIYNSVDGIEMEPYQIMVFKVTE